MLSREENELLTRIGPGTPMGRLMRRYWLPALFGRQIAEPDCAPVRVGLLGEKLVAFRDSKGRVGLIGEHCPHRTASLWFGRNEDCGLRCVYHGWKFDVDGNCVDMPSEPEGSEFRRKVRAKAYPTIERGGMIWAYMGPPERKPAFPPLQWTLLPPESLYASRHIQDCNWLQALEGGFDAAHLAFLHQGTGAVNSDLVPARHETLRTGFGMVVGSGRETPDGGIRWGANLLIMPCHKVFATTPNGAHIWAPVDDERTMLYSVDFKPDGPFTDDELARSRAGLHIHTENIPGTDRAMRNRDNDYLIDRAAQAAGGSFTGLEGLAIQDCAIQESMGPVADRTQEHLGGSDAAIIQIRRLLLDAVRGHEAGRTPPGLNPAEYAARSTRFVLPPDGDFADAVRAQLAEAYAAA